VSRIFPFFSGRRGKLEEWITFSSLMRKEKRLEGEKKAKIHHWITFSSLIGKVDSAACT